jgi:hypothetical protein
MFSISLFYLKMMSLIIFSLFVCFFLFSIETLRSLIYNAPLLQLILILLTLLAFSTERFLLSCGSGMSYFDFSLRVK